MNQEAEADIPDWAERFWLLAGKPEPFPRSLEASVLRALPLVIVKLPRLDVESLNGYLQSRCLNLQCLAAPRRLRGCLLARSGGGIVFLDGTDSADELRFTLAHEVAHFLLDHLQPRQRAVKALGPAIQDVLDGLREPTPAERLNAIFQGVSFERTEHLMDRGDDGTISRMKTLRAEDRADRLALELLAPVKSVEESLAAHSATWSDPRASDLAVTACVTEYGLPRDVAKNYARFLIARHAPSSTFRDWLREKK